MTPGVPGQRVQPILGQPQAGVIGRVPGGLHPPVAAHHRGHDRDRLAEHHQLPGADPPGSGGDQSRPAVLPIPRQAGEARSATRTATMPARPSSPAASSGRGRGRAGMPAARQRRRRQEDDTAGMSQWRGNEAPWLVEILSNPHR